MLRLTLSFSNQNEKENFLFEISKLNKHKVVNISKEYPGKGKSLHRKIYIDLTPK